MRKHYPDIIIMGFEDLEIMHDVLADVLGEGDMQKIPNKKYWIGDVGKEDDFDNPIIDEFIDGRTVMGGPWAIMTPTSWRKHGVGQLGTGYGQRYKKQVDGKWLKVEG